MFLGTFPMGLITIISGIVSLANPRSHLQIGTDLEMSSGANGNNGVQARDWFCPRSIGTLVACHSH